MSSPFLWYLFGISETRISVKSLDFKLADKRKAFSSLTRLHTNPPQRQRKLVKKYIWRWKDIRIRGIRENISTRKMVMSMKIHLNCFGCLSGFCWCSYIVGSPEGNSRLVLAMNINIRLRPPTVAPTHTRDNFQRDKHQQSTSVSIEQNHTCDNF